MFSQTSDVREYWTWIGSTDLLLFETLTLVFRMVDVTVNSGMLGSTL